MSEKAAGHSGFSLVQRPHEYERTPQQKLIAAAAKVCGIEKGMSRVDLIAKMKNCLPEAYRKLKEEQHG